MIQLQTKKMILDLFSIGSIQFGRFVLKSGITSLIYIDLRRIISFPKLVKEICDALWQLASSLEFSLICGVPLLMRCKEIKEHGTKSSIEGIFNKKQFCLVVEDMITTVQSIFEKVAPCLKKISNNPKWIYFTPGIQSANDKDSLAQTYQTPYSAIKSGQ
ncbi:Orotate phosphoribosyltransferase [Candidatus Rhabdochlamydia oedothoracis]|uniref:Orotate phosphoribosyltransferase n=1 Tax=Candidatus Rhabdochlamydia oedothoracis TaxID=2720720 RepID=A0ABX8V3R8_9BACT|nr:MULTISPECIES: hypothetical protein [Rhabdochlamydia]KAG6559202.1 Orotate phosphoribosyltransferase [Candidatus Rhabdochlamydia sp. W815]QYF48222.1 Orotate phosphoribosyltransferase [Candidatus Rhabdochlamydia oedothoracis]